MHMGNIIRHPRTYWMKTNFYSSTFFSLCYVWCFNGLEGPKWLYNFLGDWNITGILLSPISWLPSYHHHHTDGCLYLWFISGVHAYSITPSLKSLPIFIGAIIGGFFLKEVKSIIVAMVTRTGGQNQATCFLYQPVQGCVMYSTLYNTSVDTDSEQ